MTPLTESDKLTFYRLGISASIIERARLARVTTAEAEELGVKLDCEGGLLFPYFAPPNGTATPQRWTCRIRQDKPPRDREGKFERKYLSPYGDRRHLYVAPCDPAWVDDKRTPVVIVEAEKSALAGLRWSEDHDRPLIWVATGGCFGWRGKIGKTLTPEGERIDERGPLPDLEICTRRKTYVLFDANAETNPAVFAGRRTLAATLKEFGCADVRMLNLPMNLPPHINGPDDYIGAYGDAAFFELFENQVRVEQREGTTQTLDSFSTAELFAAQEKKVDFDIYPFASRGLSSILDALPKKGKTRFYLEGIAASRRGQPFLGYATRPVRVIYVSEQSAASLAMQAREVGFTGEEHIEELRWVTREHWSRHTFPELLALIRKDFLEIGYTGIIFDTWHTVARMEDENAASEVNQLGNLTLDLATQFNLWLSLSRHDRKSGGEVGMSGRSSIQLSGLVDLIMHMVGVPGQEDSSQRKLQLAGRVPNLPAETIIELGRSGYVNLGAQQEPEDRVEIVRQLLRDRPDLTAEAIALHFWTLGVKISPATAKRYRAQAKSSL